MSTCVNNSSPSRYSSSKPPPHTPMIRTKLTK
jgi:hypothetical protein